MKQKMGFFKCMDSMARDMRHPYIPCLVICGLTFVDVHLHLQMWHQSTNPHCFDSTANFVLLCVYLSVLLCMHCVVIAILDLLVLEMYNVDAIIKCCVRAFACAITLILLTTIILVIHTTNRTIL